MESRDVISLAELAARFGKAKGVAELGNWLRASDNEEEPSGNSLAVLKALRTFNETNSQPIAVYRVVGYKGSNKPTMVVAKDEIIRPKGFILRRAAAKPKGRAAKEVAFRVLEEIEV